MNIVCIICSELLQPSDDAYHTPCGHIFHFQCLTKWIERSNTCPQCRERTFAKDIHRIYFNFPNDDSIATDPVALQSMIDTLNFRITLLNKKNDELTEYNNNSKIQILSFQQEIQNCEIEIKDKNSAIVALKEQLKYCKAQCADIADKDHQIKMLNTKLEELQNVQTLIYASGNKVDDMMKTITSDDVCRLKIYVSVLKGELDKSGIQKKQLRDKLTVKHRSEMKQLEEKCKNQEEEIANLQTKLLKMQTVAGNCKCNKVEQGENCLEECKKFREKSFNLTATQCTSNSRNDVTLETEKDDCFIMSADNVENTPQNIKSRGFFSMTNRSIKRVGNSTTVPSILTKKSKLDDIMSEETVSSGMTFDGFGGHAKYDKFPMQLRSLHTKTVRSEIKM